jgi:hypothetical protein
MLGRANIADHPESSRNHPHPSPLLPKLLGGGEEFVDHTIEHAPLLRIELIQEATFVLQRGRCDGVEDLQAGAAQAKMLGTAIGITFLPLEQSGLQQSPDSAADGNLVHGCPLGHLGSGEIRIATENGNHAPFGHTQAEAPGVGLGDTATDLVGQHGEPIGQKFFQLQHGRTGVVWLENSFKCN